MGFSSFIDKLKSLKLPPLLSFIIKDGKLNPSVIQVFKDAQNDPNLETIWKKFSVKTSLGLTSGTLVLIAIGIFLLEKFSLSLQFLIDVGSKGIAVAVLGYVLYKVYLAVKGDNEDTDLL